MVIKEVTMKKLHIHLIWATVCCIFFITSNVLPFESFWYPPKGKPERYSLYFDLYFLTESEFQDMILHYHGRRNTNIIGLTAYTTHECRVYVIKDKDGNIDTEVVGHEVLHVVNWEKDHTGKSKPRFGIK